MQIALFLNCFPSLFATFCDSADSGAVSIVEGGAHLPLGAIGYLPIERTRRPEGVLFDAGDSAVVDGKKTNFQAANFQPYSEWSNLAFPTPSAAVVKDQAPPAQAICQATNSPPAGPRRQYKVRT